MNICKCFKSTISCLVLCFLLFFISCRINKEKNLKNRAEQGDVQSMYALGQANLSTYGDGIVERPNYRDAARWFEMGAKGGHAPSMYWLTQIGGITNEERVMWLKKGAELGNGACVTELINAYSQGLYGLKPDPVQSFQWVKIGWQMDFKERKYDSVIARKEYDRLINNYRSHLKVGLRQKGYKNEDIDAILSQIK